MSWQIIPPILGELLQDKDAEKAKRAMQAMMQMNKTRHRGLEASAYGNWDAPACRE